MLLSADGLYQFLIALHLIGLTFGLGGATISDFTFFSDLKKHGHISEETVTRMASFSQLIWLGLLLLGASGMGLLYVMHGSPLTIPGFIAKMLVVAVVIANGLLLNFYITPRLTSFSFTERYSVFRGSWWVRKLTFVLGAVSVTSWYGAFFIAMFKTIVLLPVWGYVVIYVAVLAFAIATALQIERRLATRGSGSFIEAPAGARPGDHASLNRDTQQTHSVNVPASYGAIAIPQQTEVTSPVPPNTMPKSEAEVATSTNEYPDVTIVSPSSSSPSNDRPSADPRG